MKRIIFLVTAFIIIALSLLSFQTPKTAEFQLTAPKGYWTSERDLCQLSEMFGTKESTLKNYLKDQNVAFLAANPDNTVQIKLVTQKNDFSNATGSLSLLSQTDLERIKAEFGNDLTEKQYLTGTDGNKYLHLSGQALAGDGTPVYVSEYITVCAGKMYSLGILSDDEKTNPDQEVFNSFSVSGATDPAKARKDGIRLGLTVLVITAMITAILFIGYTIFRDLYRRKKETETA